MNTGPGCECSVMRAFGSVRPSLTMPDTLPRVAGIVLAFAVLGLFAGCASPPVIVSPTTSFNAAKARERLEPGNNEVAGKVLLRLSSGGALTCTGGTARLIPMTPYAEEWVGLTYYQQPAVAGTPSEFAYLPKATHPSREIRLNPNFMATTRQVPCDREGQFRIEKIADGDYFLEAQLIWQQDIYDEVNFFHGRTYFSKEGTVLKPFHAQGGKVVFLDLQWTVTNRRFNF